MNSNSQGRIRRFAPKARGGCQTCKQRHTRCSQERPECTTCTMSGRQCSYGHPSRPKLGDELRVVQWKPPNSNPRQSPSATNWPGNEISYLQYFQEVCCSQLMGSFDDGFWSRTIYQISETTAAVRHAIIAVSTSWKQLEASFRIEQSANLESEKGLRHYLSAVSYIQALSKNRRGLPTHDILVCNVLFFCLELCQQDYESALRQLSSCLDVFCDWIRDSRAAEQSDTSLEEVERNLVRVFRKMFMQAVLFIDTHLMVPRIFEPELHMDSCTIPTNFDSGEEARDCLHVVVSALMHRTVTRGMAARNIAGGDPEISRPIFRLDHQELERFSLAFDRFCGRSALLNKKEVMQRSAITAQLLSLKVLAAVSICDQPEWAFDQHLSTFQSILDECSKAAKLLSESTAGVFSFDAEILSPLYFVASRCRDPLIRRQALHVLRRCDRQEGPWNGPMLAAIIERIICCEEEGLDISDRGTSADLRCRLTLTDAIINSRSRVVEGRFARREDGSQDITVQIEEIAY